MRCTRLYGAAAFRPDSAIENRFFIEPVRLNTRKACELGRYAARHYRKE